MGFLRNMSGWEWALIILLIVVVFGWKKLPDAARSLGRSMRIFKSEVEQMSSDKESRSAASSDTVESRIADESAKQAPPGAAQQSPAAPGAGPSTSQPGSGDSTPGPDPAPGQDHQDTPAAERDQQPHHHA